MDNTDNDVIPPTPIDYQCANCLHHSENSQGDPLSPILFNIALDELILHLNQQHEGGTICEGTKVTAIAFADDIALMTDNPATMIPLLADVELFPKNRGMTLNPQKSVALVRDRLG